MALENYHSIYHPDGNNWKESDRLSFEFYFEQWIRRMSGSVQHIYLMQQIPECDYPFFANRFFAWHVTHWGRLPQYVENYAEQMDALKDSREFLSNLASKYHNVMILDPLPHIYDEQGRIKLHNRGRAFYLDRDHLTTQGALAYLLPMLEEAASFPPVVKPESDEKNGVGQLTK